MISLIVFIVHSVNFENYLYYNMRKTVACTFYYCFYGDTENQRFTLKVRFELQRKSIFNAQKQITGH